MEKMNIYKKSGASVSSFSRTDYDKWDDHGREVCKSFFNQYGWKVKNNDGKGTIIENIIDTDLKILTPSNSLYYVEAETKLSGFDPKYLHSGLHFTWRKIHSILNKKQRDPEKTLFITVNKDGDQLILVRGKYLSLAYEIWPEYGGYNGTQASSNFTMPKHNCYPLLKSTFRGKKPEHFISIDWNRCAHYVKKNSIWKREKDSDRKFL